MISDISFKSRGQTVEDAFFRNVDQALIEYLREESVSGEARKKLSESTGITNESILDELLDVGVSHSAIVALLLLPLAKVAWADGQVDSKESTIVLNTAFALGYAEESSGVKLLKDWLGNEPDDRLFTIWQQYARALCANLTSSTQDQLSELIVERSRAVARATGGVFGVHRISSSESRVIKKIESATTH